MRITVFETISETRSWVEAIRSGGGTIGMVPTMGALHQGHISLVKRAKTSSDYVIASIFVNPTQFNNQSDLAKYPRTIEADIRMLHENGCDAVFIPSVAEMYPAPEKGHWDFGLLSDKLEGHFRPGHFDGVCTIVKKLFEAVTPDKAFFGEKDFQQLAIIRSLVRSEKMPVEIVGVPTMREEDGLAMSSRNMRLTPQQRKDALAISRTLFWVKEHKDKLSPPVLEEQGRKMLESSPGLQLEYFEIVDGDTFEDINNWAVSRPVALFAGYAGEVRLIDNILL